MQDLLIHFSFGDQGWGDEIASGALITILLALATLPFGFLLGLGLGLAKNSDDYYLRRSSSIFTTIFRGLPELLTLFLVYYGVPILLNIVMNFLFGIDIQVSAFVAGMIALGLVFASFASEVFLSALRSLGQGQYDGAHALGLSSRQTFWLVIFPQLLRLSLPGLSNLWLILIRETALVSAISINDTLRWTRVAAADTKEHLAFFFVAYMIYVLFGLLSQIGIHFLERWTKGGNS